MCTLSPRWHFTSARTLPLHWQLPQGTQYVRLFSSLAAPSSTHLEELCICAVA